MGLNFDEIDDAVLTVQDVYINRGSFLDLTSDLQDHVAVRELWGKRKKAFEGGNNWKFTVQMDHNHSYKPVGMYETDSSTMVDTLTEGYMEPRHINAHYEYDLRHPAFQGGRAKIADYIKIKLNEMKVSYYEGLEGDCWTCPAATDTKSIHGIPHWITKCSNGEAGFNGDDPSGYESIGRAHILSSSYPRWRNWAADYESISKSDLVRKMREGSYAIQFRSPLSHPEPNLGAMGNGIYVNRNTIVLIEELLENQNMNLGTDLDSMGGRARFKSSPLIYVPYLDNDTTNPVYMIDWRWMAFGTLPGWSDRMQPPYMVPGKHLVRRVDQDSTLELVCTNLRRQAVFSVVS